VSVTRTSADAGGCASKRESNPVLMGAQQGVMQPVQLLENSTRSRIILCRLNGDEQTEAPVVLKAIRVTDASTAELVAREVTLSARNCGAFVVTAAGWFNAPGEVYMMLDYCPGGDVGRLIDREGALSPHAARFYIGCAALALEALHDHSVIHRDVKPENMVIAADGYAKLADLGYARELPRGARAATLLGTPEYLAPEGFLGEGQDARSDIWSLGTSLYVMLLASHPHGGAPPELYQRVLNEPLFFPANHFTFSTPAKEFLSACLSHAAARRPSAAEVWNYDFFANSMPPTHKVPALSKKEMLLKAVKPPFVPRLAGGPLDTRYFAEVEDSGDEAEDEQGGRGKRAAEHSDDVTCGITMSAAGGSKALARSEAALRLADGAAAQELYTQLPCVVRNLVVRR
jgi:serine/threonine protein kinase